MFNWRATRRKWGNELIFHFYSCYWIFPHCIRSFLNRRTFRYGKKIYKFNSIFKFFNIFSLPHTNEEFSSSAIDWLPDKWNQKISRQGEQFDCLEIKWFIHQHWTNDCDRKNSDEFRIWNSYAEMQSRRKRLCLFHKGSVR